MIFYRCDRCGKGNVKGSVRLTRKTMGTPRYIDLCGECLDSLKSWMKERKGESDDEQRR